MAAYGHLGYTKSGRNFATGLPIDVMFGSNVGFSESADLMVQLSTTLSDPEPQSQGHSLVQRRISRKGCMLRPNRSSALCVYDEYTVSADNIHTYSNDTNIARCLSNS